MNRFVNNLRLSDLERGVSELKVSVLPDFFLDRIIQVPSLDKLFKQAEAKATVGGGNLRGYSQTEVRGGNATNLAFALAALPVRTTLYCVGDALAEAVLMGRPENCNVRLISGRPSFTVALEFPFRGRVVNVMISDVGDVTNFDGRALHQNDIQTLRKSDCIALTNWSANKSGNTLARKVFSLESRKPTLTFLDPADLDGAEGRVEELKSIIDEGLVDVISLNENEARILARTLATGRLPQRYTTRDIVRTAAKLHGALHATVDIHTPIGSASASMEEQTWEPALGSLAGFVTGAGDVWDAGDVVGHLMHFSAQDRLRLANASAYLYLSSGRVRPPRLREVERFLAKRKSELTKVHA
jgi:ribokinase